MIAEHKTESIPANIVEHQWTEFKDLISFFQGPDRFTFDRLTRFFSKNSRYLDARELKVFWESLTIEEQRWWRAEAGLINFMMKD